jgi:hypothetical protein
VVVEATERKTQQRMAMRRDYSRQLRVLVAYLLLSCSHHYLNVQLAKIPSLDHHPPSHSDWRDWIGEYASILVRRPCGRNRRYARRCLNRVNRPLRALNQLKRLPNVERFRI